MKRALLFGAIALWLLAAQLAAEEIVVPRFDISRILLEGNTILPPLKLTPSLKNIPDRRRISALCRRRWMSWRLPTASGDIPW